MRTIVASGTSSTALGAPVGRAGLARWQRRARSRSRGRRENVIGVGIACVFLAVLVAVGLISSDWVPISMQPFGFSFKTTAGRLAKTTADGFVKTRTGKVLFSRINSDLCRQVSFSNETGRFSDDKLVRCDDALSEDSKKAESRQDDAGGRFNSLRDSFMNR